MSSSPSPPPTSLEWLLQVYSNPSISKYTIGFVGLCISGSLFFLSLWRLFHHYDCCYTITSSTSSCRLSFRRFFHWILCLAMLVESLSYADLCGILPLSSNRSLANRWGYVLLQVLGRSLLEVLAFSIVTALWFEAVHSPLQSSSSPNNTRTRANSSTSASATTPISSNNNNDDTQRRNNNDTTGSNNRRQQHVVVQHQGKQHCGLKRCFFYTLAIFLFLISLAQALFALLILHDDDDDGWKMTLSWHINVCHKWIETLCWALHGILACTCGIKTTRKIIQLPAYPSSHVMVRFRLFSKALIPMILCALCYLSRSLWLVVAATRLVITRHYQDDDYNNDNNGIVWWIMVMWIPTVLPSLCLLYSARKRQISSSSTTTRQRRRRRRRRRDDPLTSPLLLLSSPPGPPAEAFISFQQLEDSFRNMSLTSANEDDPYEDEENENEKRSIHDTGNDDDDEDEEQSVSSHSSTTSLA